MSFQVRVEPPAERKLGSLDRPTRERVIKRFGELARDPFELRTGKPLKGVRKLRSSRVGDWRIIYTVDIAERAVHILSVNPRGQAYRNL